jgi:predicted flap endonuclease-1-like 5' DNA nuclease
VDVGFIHSGVFFGHIMILRKIKQLLGLGSNDSSRRSETDVVVQEDSSEPDTETEAAVKGVGKTDEADNGQAEEVDGDVDDPVATGTEAAASTESLVDEEEAEVHPESSAEPAEAAGPGADEERTDIEEAEPDTDAADVEENVDGATAEEADLEEAADETSVDDIKGIGPAYSKRLGEVGINTVTELAEADPAELAERVTVAEKTVAKWVDRAKEFGN